EVLRSDVDRGRGSGHGALLGWAEDRASIAMLARFGGPHVHRTQRRAGAAAARAARLLREAADARAARGARTRARHRPRDEGRPRADGEGRLALLRLAQGVRRPGP